MRTIPIFTLSLLPGFGCYTASFDPDASDAYFCTQTEDCTEEQICALSRCVSDVGPRIFITGPEPVSRLDAMGELAVTIEVSELVLEESVDHTEGSGYLEVRLDGEPLAPVYFGEEGVAGLLIPLTDMPGGAHRIQVMAMYGDGVPYENPSALDQTTFFIDDGLPHIALVEPFDSMQVRAGQEMLVIIAAINFQVSNMAKKCSPAAVIDEMDDVCFGEPLAGHSHVYLLDDYPGCLQDALPCTTSYAVSIKPAASDMIQDRIPNRYDGYPVFANLVPPDKVEEGEKTLSVGLQYDDHSPFPAPAESIFDQGDLHVIP